MKIDYCTDVGLKRQNNQDSFSFCQLDEKTVFACVCDGMGGYNGGEVASKIASEYITENVKENYLTRMKQDSVERMIKTATENASSRIAVAARNDINLRQMGTTAVSVFVRDNEGIVFNTGDSRCYLYRKSDNSLIRLTKDHSKVQELVDLGVINETQARESKTKNTITSCLGYEQLLKIDSSFFDVESGDMILLCTDGLTNEVADEKIKSVLSSDTDQLANALVSLANDNGGRDNVTALIIST